MFVATLISPGKLASGDIEEAIGRLHGKGCRPGEWNWIDEGYAADIPFEAGIDAARGALWDPLDLDIVVQLIAHRQKKLLVADMDSTMIGQECIDELADYAGIKPQVAAITERAMQGELDFASALQERVALLKGLDEQVIDQCLAERIRLTPGASTLVRTMRARGAETILVSGGFTSFVAPIAERIGFDRFEANVLGVEDGKLTGLTEGEVVDSGVKLAVLMEARDQLGLSTDETMAIGDGANDIPMIIEAGLGIAFHAKPALAAVAHALIRHNDLTALLFAQGIPRSEWVDA